MEKYITRDCNDETEGFDTEKEAVESINNMDSDYHPVGLYKLIAQTGTLQYEKDEPTVDLSKDS